MANREQVVRDLDRVIGLIKTDAKDIPAETKQQMMKETIHHFNEYVSPGWLQYRKSVSSETDGDVVLEWEDGGSYFYGLNGEKFLDCLGGFGIYTAGHSEPEIVDVVKAQLNRQGLHSQELIDPLRGYLAKAVADITPGDLKQCFFTNCGTEAVEMALKLARFKTGGRWYISTIRAFHGKTAGSLSVGGKSTYREPYLPLVQQVTHVEYGNADAMRTAIENLEAVGEKIAAVILEPIQGEAGVIVPPPGYLKEVRKICDEHNLPLILDEIQTGMGRTGTMWRCEAEDVVPDIMTFGKAFGGGVMPITGFISDGTYFLQPDPYNTITVPSATPSPICTACYNHQNQSLYLYSGRGYALNGYIKPDLAAPGVNISGPRAGGGFTQKSGTSISAAYTAGAAAQLMEWAVTNGNQPDLNSEEAAAYLLRGADRSFINQYPNREWGYGTLNMLGTFEAMTNY